MTLLKKGLVWFETEDGEAWINPAMVVAVLQKQDGRTTIFVGDEVEFTVDESARGVVYRLTEGT